MHILLCFLVEKRKIENHQQVEKGNVESKGRLKNKSTQMNTFSTCLYGFSQRQTFPHYLIHNNNHNKVDQKKKNHNKVECIP